MPLRLDLLLLRDLVVDRLDDLRRRLQVAQEKRRDSGDAERRAAGPRPGHQRGIDERFHRAGDLGALGDVVDRVLHHRIAHAFADGVANGAVDLVLIADLGVDVRGLLRIDLPAQPHVHGHAHLLTRQCRDLLDLLSRERILLLAGRKPLDAGPRRHDTDAGKERVRIDEAERVPHADLAGVDDHERGLEYGQHADNERDEAEEAEGTADRAAGAAFTPHGCGAESKKECDRKEHQTKDERAHVDS